MTLEELIVYESQFDQLINLNYKIDEMYEHTLGKDDCVIFIATEKNNPVGYVMAYKQKDNKAYNEKFVTIMNLFVKEKYRHLGIGTKLLDTVEKWAKRLYCNCVIELDCFVDNITSINFYSKLNYKPIRVKMRKKI